MRELKFRAWDTVSKRYVLEYETLLVNPYGFESYGNKYIWEQYTGLKDKNGKEIYEGDIVEYSWDFRGEKRKNNYVVEWLSGKVEHYPYSVDSGFTLPDSVDGYMVVGNIRENPKLLEQEDAKG